MLLSVQSCTVGDYYVTREGDKKTSVSTLYSDESIVITLYHFGGRISRLPILNLKKSEGIEIKILEVEHNILIDGVVVEPLSISGYEQGTLNFSGESSVYISSKTYELDGHPEVLIETINISLLVENTQINISKEFLLERVTYNYFQAMQGI